MPSDIPFARIRLTAIADQLKSQGQAIPAGRIMAIIDECMTRAYVKRGRARVKAPALDERGMAAIWDHLMREDGKDPRFKLSNVEIAKLATDALKLEGHVALDRKPYAGGRVTDTINCYRARGKFL